MIVASLSGGLGNQMFQYAFARKVAILNDFPLKLDIRNYSTDFLRNYELDNYTISAEVASLIDITEVRKEHSKFETYKRKLNTFLTPRYKHSIIHETQFHFEKDLLKINHPVYLAGYWQSPQYFSGIENILRKEFTYNKPLSSYCQEIYSEISNNSEICSIHIRRGDYVSNQDTNKAHGICSVDYYINALFKLNKIKKISHIYIFSDDHAWVKKNIRFDIPITCVDKTANLHEDLYLMRCCHNNIIANSSFSWWGAWLNTNSSKIVIAPKKWFANRKGDTIDLIPQNWQRI